MLTRTEIERTAAAVNSLRPDWPIKSLVTFIEGNLAGRAYRDTTVALAWVATDPETKTPKRVLEDGPWWRATVTADNTASRIVTRCAHGNDAARCTDCNPRDAANVDHAAGKAACIAALRAGRYQAPPPRPEPMPDHSALDRARDQLDKETNR